MTNCINYIKQKYRLQDKDLMITIQTWAAGVTTQSNSSGLTNYSITIIKDPIRQLNDIMARMCVLINQQLFYHL